MFFLIPKRIKRLIAKVVVSGMIPEYPEFTFIEKQKLRAVLNFPLSMCTAQNLAFTIWATKLIDSRNLSGDFLEVGAWRGGHGVLFLQNTLDPVRNAYLFDTFSGMTEPNLDEFNLHNGRSAVESFMQLKAGKGTWSPASLEEVEDYFSAFGIANSRRILIKGDVLETLIDLNTPLPTQIAILRLDSDWYESTNLSLQVLYPRLCSSGILIVDDYGSWSGSKRAVDEYLVSIGLDPASCLWPIDNTARYMIKP